MRCDKLDIIFDNTEYSFTRLKDKRVWIAETGFGTPPIKHIMETGPKQHGSTHLDFRLESRTIQLAFAMIANNPTDHMRMRTELIEIFRPSNDNVTLKYTYPDGSTIRQIDCFNNGGLSMDYDRGKDRLSKIWTIQLLCPDPTWYDPDEKSNTYSTVEIGELVFPFTFDDDRVVFGLSSLGSATDLVYNGTWLTYPIITITGPIQFPSIKNNTTDEEIKLNYEVSSGEIITMNLQYGEKTVMNNSNENLIGSISDDSDLSTFHIAPSPEAPGGINSMTISGGGLISGTSEVEISYYERYIGV